MEVNRLRILLCIRTMDSLVFPIVLTNTPFQHLTVTFETALSANLVTPYAGVVTSFLLLLVFIIGHEHRCL